MATAPPPGIQTTCAHATAPASMYSQTLSAAVAAGRVKSVRLFNLHSAPGSRIGQVTTASTYKEKCTLCWKESASTIAAMTFLDLGSRAEVFKAFLETECMTTADELRSTPCIWMHWDTPSQPISCAIDELWLRPFALVESWLTQRGASPPPMRFAKDRQGTIFSILISRYNLPELRAFWQISASGKSFITAMTQFCTKSAAMWPKLVAHARKKYRNAATVPASTTVSITAATSSSSTASRSSAETESKTETETETATGTGTGTEIDVSAAQRIVGRTVVIVAWNSEWISRYLEHTRAWASNNFQIRTFPADLATFARVFAQYSSEMKAATAVAAPADSSSSFWRSSLMSQRDWQLFLLRAALLAASHAMTDDPPTQRVSFILQGCVLSAETLCTLNRALVTGPNIDAANPGLTVCLGETLVLAQANQASVTTDVCVSEVFNSVQWSTTVPLGATSVHAISTTVSALLRVRDALDTKADFGCPHLVLHRAATVLEPNLFHDNTNSSINDKTLTENAANASIFNGATQVEFDWKRLPWTLSGEGNNGNTFTGNLFGVICGAKPRISWKLADIGARRITAIVDKTANMQASAYPTNSRRPLALTHTQVIQRWRSGEESEESSYKLPGGIGSNSGMCGDVDECSSVLSFSGESSHSAATSLSAGRNLLREKRNLRQVAQNESAVVFLRPQKTELLAEGLAHGIRRKTRGEISADMARRTEQNCRAVLASRAVHPACQRAATLLLAALRRGGTVVVGTHWVPTVAWRSAIAQSAIREPDVLLFLREEETQRHSRHPAPVLHDIIVTSGSWSPTVLHVLVHWLEIAAAHARQLDALAAQEAQFARRAQNPHRAPQDAERLCQTALTQLDCLWHEAASRRGDVCMMSQKLSWSEDGSAGTPRVGPLFVKLASSAGAGASAHIRAAENDSAYLNSNAENSSLNRSSTSIRIIETGAQLDGISSASDSGSRNENVLGPTTNRWTYNSEAIIDPVPPFPRLHRSVIVLMLARDSEPYIAHFFAKTAARLVECFSELRWTFCVLENGSSDRSRAALETMRDKSAFSVVLETCSVEETDRMDKLPRPQKLGMLRNMLVARLCAQGVLRSESDEMVLTIDTDVLFGVQTVKTLFDVLYQRDDVAMVCANACSPRVGFMYDTLSYNHGCFYFKRMQLALQMRKLQQDQQKTQNNLAVHEVETIFNGMSLVRSDTFLQCRYGDTPFTVRTVAPRPGLNQSPAVIQCEHYQFCRTARTFGKVVLAMDAKATYIENWLAVSQLELNELCAQYM